MLQSCSMEGLYGLARICEMLCCDGGFKEYYCKGLHGIATDLILKGTELVTELELIPSAKLLGLEIDSELSFTSHVEKLCKKLSLRIGVLKKIRSCLPTKQRLLYYNTMIRSVLHYVSSIWTSCDKENLSRVLKL